MMLPRNIRWPGHAGDVAVDANPVLAFLRQWVRNPVQMAAVSPSGRELAQRMVEPLPPGAQRVVEIGAGTGVFTRALLASGIDPSRLLVIEINPDLARFLQGSFPKVHVACADARYLPEIAEGEGLLADGARADAVVSGLGLLAMSRALKRQLLRAAFSVLGEQGRFIQFTYGPFSPISRGVLDEFGLYARRTATAWRNLPPANVFVYRRRHSRQLCAIPAQERGHPWRRAS
jgi:phosphatidylethanolamine/phosphatidyl-N-methylethanolamine N-methyltransferase